MSAKLPRLRTSSLRKEKGTTTVTFTTRTEKFFPFGDVDACMIERNGF